MLLFFSASPATILIDLSMASVYPKMDLQPLLFPHQTQPMVRMAASKEVYRVLNKIHLEMDSNRQQSTVLQTKKLLLRGIVTT